MYRSSTYLSQISDLRCALGDVDQPTFEKTLKASAFLFDDLRINVTDILSNQYFQDVFWRDEETAYQWLSSDGVNGPAILCAVARRGESFEEVAEAMVRTGTRTNLREPETILPYAKTLDRTYPKFVPVDDHRAGYATRLSEALATLQNVGLMGVGEIDLRRTAQWLHTQPKGELAQSKLFEFLELELKAPLASTVQLKRVSDTCYYVAQSESLNVSHLCVEPIGAEIIESLSHLTSDPGPRLTTGARVEEVRSHFPSSVLSKLTPREIAKFRREKACNYLREAVYRLTMQKTSLQEVTRALNECLDPLHKLADARTGDSRIAILRDLKTAEKAAWKEVLVGVAVDGVPAVIYAVQDLLGYSDTSDVYFYRSGVALTKLWKKTRLSNVLSANVSLAKRFSQHLDDSASQLRNSPVRPTNTGE